MYYKLVAGIILLVGLCSFSLFHKNPHQILMHYMRLSIDQERFLKKNMD